MVFVFVASALSPRGRETGPFSHPQGSPEPMSSIECCRGLWPRAARTQICPEVRTPFKQPRAVFQRPGAVRRRIVNCLTRDAMKLGRWRRTAIAAGTVVVVAVVLYVMLRPRADRVQAAAPARGMAGRVSVTTVTAKNGDIGVYLDAIGTVTPVYTSTITSQVVGMISAVHYRESQYVRKGDPLIDIDPRPFQAQLEQAQGLLERDTHILEQSRMDLQRFRDAWARDAIAKQTLDDQEKLALQNEGTVKNDQGTVAFQRTQLEYCRIRAPFDGRVGLRLVDPGNVVQANSTTALVVLTQMQPITVVFPVAEDYLTQIQSADGGGQRLRVVALDRAKSTTLATGVLVAVDNQIDTTTGTVRLRAQFDNRKNELFPNQFVNTRLLLRTVREAVLIPTSAIQHNGTNSFVYLISGSTAHMRAVTPGPAEAGATAVEGLKQGDVVANSSFERLRDNAAVVVAP
jgi:multidrug efflux system membrane fusion protein